MPRRRIIGKLQKGEVWRGIRTAMNINGSLAVTLPKEFTVKHGIEPGDDMLVIAGKVLKIYPLPRDGNKGRHGVNKGTHEVKMNEGTQSQGALPDGAGSTPVPQQEGSY